MRFETAHQELLSGMRDHLCSQDDFLSLMVLLHTHRIRMRGSFFKDRPGVTEIAAETQRGAAEVVAALWPDPGDRQRAHYVYWYWAFNTTTPYETVDEVPLQRRKRLEFFRQVLLSDPRVQSIEPED